MAPPHPSAATADPDGHAPLEESVHLTREHHLSFVYPVVNRICNTVVVLYTSHSKSNM